MTDKSILDQAKDAASAAGTPNGANDFATCVQIRSQFVEGRMT